MVTVLPTADSVRFGRIRWVSGTKTRFVPSTSVNGVVTNDKIKKGTIALDRLSPGARNSLAGKQGASGANGANGRDGLVRAYGHITNSGALDTSKAHAGITSSRAE